MAGPGGQGNELEVKDGIVYDVIAFIGEGTVDEAEELVSYTRFMIGVNGVVTYKKSTLPEALKRIPMDRLVLETDSPYLPPVPFRGKRNESSYVKRVAQKLAELYDMEIGEVERKTTANALKVFKILE